MRVYVCMRACVCMRMYVCVYVYVYIVKPSQSIFDRHETPAAFRKLIRMHTHIHTILTQHKRRES